VNLKSMSISKLSKLKDQVDAILRTKVADQRRSLETELTKLSRFSTSQLRSKGSGVHGPVAPQSGKSERNLGRTWIDAALARGSTQSRQKARALQHRTDGQTSHKEGAQRGPQSQKAMTDSPLAIGAAYRYQGETAQRVISTFIRDMITRSRALFARRRTLARV